MALYSRINRILLKKSVSSFKRIPHEYYSHSINQRSLALKTVGCLLPDLVQEVVEWKAEDERLQNLACALVVSKPQCDQAGNTYRIHITHVAGVDQATRFQEGDLIPTIHAVAPQGLS